jgi:2-aminobenzoate-CoA ligase
VLLGFTSGTAGEPRATMHFHRDLLIIADGHAREVLKVTSDDVFVGSPPPAFTFGLGATATLLENASPTDMIDIIETYGHDGALRRAGRRGKTGVRKGTCEV